MSELWNKIARLVSRRTLATLIVVVLVTVGLGFGLKKLDFATGQDSYIDPSSQVAKDNERYQNLFGGENMVVLFTVDEGKSIADLFTPANIAQFAEVEKAMRTSPAVRSVVSPVTLLQWTQDLVLKGVASEIIARTIAREPDPAMATLRQQDALVTTLRLGAAGKQTMDNPDWVKFLLYGNDGFSLDGQKLVVPSADQMHIRKPLQAFIPDVPNPRFAVLAGVLVGNAPLDELAKGSTATQDALRGRTFENASVTITGTPTFLTDINDYLQGGMMILGGIAVLVMMVILLVAFKVRWRLLPLLGMAVGIAWGFGIFGFTGTKLSLVTIAGLPILIGLGIEFAIQIQNRIEEERTVERSASPFETTLRHMGPALVAATVAAVIAFLTVKISKVPMVQDFGVLLSIGIVALLIAGIVIPVTVIGARERRSPTVEEPVESWVERTVDRLGSLPRMMVLPLVIIAVVLPVLGLVMERGSKIESDPINWANQSSMSIKNARTLERDTKFSTTLGIFVETTSAPENGVFTDQMGAFVFDLVEQASAENKEFAGASSLATTVGWLAEVPNTTPLPPTGLDMLQAYQIAPAALQSLLVADNGNATQVLFQVGPSSLDERSVVLDRVHASIADPTGGALPAEASATTGGLAVVGVGLLENITANRAQLTIVALLLVGAFIVLRYRDLTRGLLTMVPVLVATGTAAVLVRVLNITLSPLSTVGGPLVVATCAEFSVLLIARYAEERERGLDPEQSTHMAAKHTGRAFFTSALTTLGGFAVLMFSSLPLLADFGVVVTVNIGVALLSALVVVPPLVKEADRRGLLAVGPPGTHDHTRGRRSVAGWIGGAVIAAIGVAILLVSVRDDKATAATIRSEASVEAPATIPAPTTTVPRPTTTIATTTTLAPGVTIAPGATSTTAPAPVTLPAGPAERPTNLIGGIFYDTLTGVGVEPGIARCAADELMANNSEADLIGMGIATVPRPAAVNALLDSAAKACGVTQEQLDAAAAAAAG